MNKYIRQQILNAIKIMCCIYLLMLLVTLSLSVGEKKASEPEATEMSYMVLSLEDEVTIGNQNLQIYSYEYKDAYGIRVTNGVDQFLEFPEYNYESVTIGNNFISIGDSIIESNSDGVLTVTTIE